MSFNILLTVGGSSWHAVYYIFYTVPIDAIGIPDEGSIEGNNTPNSHMSV